MTTLPQTAPVRLPRTSVPSQLAVPGMTAPALHGGETILVGAVIPHAEDRGFRIERRKRLGQLQSGRPFIDVDRGSQFEDLFANGES